MKIKRHTPHFEEAAERFMRRLFPSFQREQLDRNSPERPVWYLVRAAFRLYELEWDCHDHDVRTWRWPFEELKESLPFAGSREPWGVLLWYALVLVQEHRKAAREKVVKLWTGPKNRAR